MVTRRAGAAARKKTTTVDFKGIEGRKTVPEGDYKLKVVEVTKEEGNEFPYFKWQFEIVDDDKKVNGAKLYTNTSLNPKSLWALRNLLEVLGVEVPDGALEIDFDDLVDLECGASVIHEDYEGRKQNKIADFFMLDDGEGGGDKEDELPKLKSDDISEMKEAELKDVIEKYSLDVDLAKLNSLRRKANAVIDKLDEGGFLEE